MRIYAVSCNKGRAERLQRAAAPLSLDIVIVPSPKADDPEVVYRGRTSLEKNMGYPTGIAATIGHIRAMKQLVDDGAEWGIVIEDDVRFHKDFSRIVDTLEKSVTDADIISLGFVNFPGGTTDYIEDIPLIKNVGLSNPWGAQCYMITRQYATHLVNLFYDVDDLYTPYEGHFVTDWVLFDPVLGCRRHTLINPIAVEDPSEPTIAGSNNKPDLFPTLHRDSFSM
jgi:GR25 family glycosyltransferase involved in LPS biosynthesis